MIVKHKPLINQYAINADNKQFLLSALPVLKESVDLLYLDPTIDTEEEDFSYGNWATGFRRLVGNALPLLKSTGIIVISAKDAEMPHIRIALDKQLGESNFIGMITVDTGNVNNTVRLLSVTHDYILLYAKDMKALLKNGTKWRMKREGLDALRKQERKLRSKHGDDYDAITRELKDWLKTQALPDRLKRFYNADERGLYTYSDLSSPKNGLFYDVVNPNTGNKVAVPTRGWGISEETFQELILDNQIIWGSTDEQQPLKKLYLKDTPDQVLRSTMSFPSRSPEKLLKRILGEEIIYQDSKGLEYMKQLIDVLTPLDAVILDLYAGSGTTGHAVLDLNYENPESNRRFILVTHDYGNVYTQILKPRLEAVISGKWMDRQHRPRRAVLKTELPKPQPGVTTFNPLTRKRESK